MSVALHLISAKGTNLVFNFQNAVDLMYSFFSKSNLGIHWWNTCPYTSLVRSKGYCIQPLFTIAVSGFSFKVFSDIDREQWSLLCVCVCVVGCALTYTKTCSAATVLKWRWTESQTLMFTHSFVGKRTSTHAYTLSGLELTHYQMSERKFQAVNPSPLQSTALLCRHR